MLIRLRKILELIKEIRAELQATIAAYNELMDLLNSDSDPDAALRAALQPIAARLDRLAQIQR